MKNPKKHTFYPALEVAAELKEIPRGQLSERVNDLILKGLTFERQQEIVRAYAVYDAALAQGPIRSVASSSAQYLAEGAFQSEDEVEDFV